MRYKNLRKKFCEVRVFSTISYDFFTICHQGAGGLTQIWRILAEVGDGAQEPGCRRRANENGYNVNCGAVSHTPQPLNGTERRASEAAVAKCLCGVCSPPFIPYRSAVPKRPPIDAR